MSRPIKLLILIILSLSVYFIFQITKESNIKIVTLGDSFSLGTNYIDYYKEYLENKNINVDTINYSKEDLSIHELLKDIKTNSKIKKDLREANVLFLNIGYNDLLYKLSLKDTNIKRLNNIINEIDIEYNELIKEINKYYTKDIIVIGYPKTNKEDYYLNIGIRRLNKVLNKVLNKDKFIDTYSLLNNRNKYFSNPKSNCPNRQGYIKISEEIEKILDK